VQSVVSLWTAIGEALDHENAKAKGMRNVKEKAKKDNGPARKKAKLASCQISDAPSPSSSTALPAPPSISQI